MTRDQKWFEMPEVRKRRLSEAVWIPLRASSRQASGEAGMRGYECEFFGAGSLAIPLERRMKGADLGWAQIGLIHDQRVVAAEHDYKPIDVYRDSDGMELGVELVLEQGLDGTKETLWFLHQDLEFALGLRREGDSWTRPQEGFVEAARLLRHEDRTPRVLEIRAEHLRDYLAARRMALRVVLYYQREAVLEDASHLGWPEFGLREERPDERFETRRSPIHEGGAPFGTRTAVFHVGRNDVDPEVDVPLLGEQDNTNTTYRSWGITSSGRRLWRASGEFWRNEWIEPGATSPRVRNDHVPSTCYFVVDAAGTRESADSLNDEDVGRWLWFRPEVVEAVTSRRGGSLRWYTRDTGQCSGLAGYGVHFGVNSRDLITTYAHDVARLPECMRTIWAGHNVSPDGKVSEELLAAQVEAVPASTTAPEELLAIALKDIDEACRARWGSTLFRSAGARDVVLANCHRFRSRDQASFLSLAKDVARITADSIDSGPLLEVARPKSGEKRGTLKSLEWALCSLVPAEEAKRLMGPLFGVYELRIGDAHLPSKDLKASLSLVRIDCSSSWLRQGMQLMQVVADSLNALSAVLRP